MALFLPPYISKMIDKYEKELLNAKKKVIKAQKNLEYANEYVKLCEKKLNDIKKEPRKDDK